MTITELSDVPLIELARGTVGVRSARRWTVYVPGCRPGRGETYLEAFAAALRTRVSN